MRPAAVGGDVPDAARRRNEQVVGERHDLCVVFAAREDEELPLAELAHERGMSVRRHVQ